MGKGLITILLLFVFGCSAMKPPRLLVVERHQLGGHLGAYMGGTIYLAPGADEKVLTHELGHWLGGKNERDAQWYEIYLWGIK